MRRRTEMVVGKEVFYEEAPLELNLCPPRGFRPEPAPEMKGYTMTSGLVPSKNTFFLTGKTTQKEVAFLVG